MKYNINDFNICSTECDSLLLFNSKYQRAVTKLINKLLQDFKNNNPTIEITEPLTLLCHHYVVEIKGKNSLYLWGMLDRALYK